MEKQRNNQLLWIVLGLVAVCLFVVVWKISPRRFVLQPTESIQETQPAAIDLSDRQLDHQIVSIRLAERPLRVEVVNTVESITQGLSDRTEIGADGMLFVFERPTEAVFWMKNMRFDLDLVWISDKRVIGISSHVPKPSPGTAEADLELYPAPEKVDMVLEIPAGMSEVWGIRPGSLVEYE